MPSTSTKTSQTLQDRQQQLGAVLRDASVEALVLNPGPTLTYLTGLHFHLSERPVVLFFNPDETPVLVLPELEMAKVEHLAYPLRTFAYGEAPGTWLEAFRRGAEAAGISRRTVGVEPRALRVLELRLLEQAAPGASFVSAEEPLAALRLRKDDTALAAMRAAVDVAQRAVQATLPALRSGMTERELASELLLQLFRAGTEAELPFAPIVSFGPNSANPHAVPTDRRLAPGDLVLLDWGASAHGYFSDITRVFAFGKVDDELEKIAAIVHEANQAAFAAAGPGVPAGHVDRAARTIITDAGYGPYFRHRTGHGLGMEGHEPPYIREDNTAPLEPGMTFTIEPGIYLADRGGVRIEDDVVITQEGAESLTDLPRELVRVA